MVINQTCTIASESRYTETTSSEIGITPLILLPLLITFRRSRRGRLDLSDHDQSITAVKSLTDAEVEEKSSMELLQVLALVIHL